MIACVAGGIFLRVCEAKPRENFKTPPSIFGMASQFLCQDFDRADDPAGYRG